MENDLISVVVPAYNCAPWLPRCIDSLLTQTYQNMEIIVVDDESSDNTPEVLQIYREKYANFRFLRKKNGGEYAARLSGVDIAKGSWIGFVDADDEVEPEMYRMLYENAKENHADISHCGYKVIYCDGKVEYLQNSGLRKAQDRETGIRDLLEEKIVESGLCNKLFRRELFEGLWQWMDFSIVNNGDLLMNYYLFHKAERSFLEDVCPYHYLIRQNSASRRKPNDHTLFDPIRAREIVWEQCDPELKDDAMRSVVRMILVSYRALTMEKKEEYVKQEQKLRRMLEEKKQYLPILSKKNAVQLKMVCRAPWLYRGLYPLFAKLFR